VGNEHVADDCEFPFDKFADGPLDQLAPGLNGNTGGANAGTVNVSWADTRHRTRRFNASAESALDGHFVDARWTGTALGDASEDVVVVCDGKAGFGSAAIDSKI
jgi:hypothetical protein